MLDEAYAGAYESVANPFGVTSHAGPNEVVLIFTGEADVSAAPLLAHALSRASRYRHARVAVDLADLDFIDTYCLGIIFDARDELRARDADLVLRSPRPSVRRLLDILQREDLIEPT
ncbi:MAG TPA: STAS domain-containing protein [Acidimicrobiia bacterium]|jgi:anti-anti-sigma factor|nr:STAS domain-containing protein [Acidimicrobiia bacterium]